MNPVLTSKGYYVDIKLMSNETLINEFKHFRQKYKQRIQTSIRNINKKQYYDFLDSEVHIFNIYRLYEDELLIRNL